MDSKRRSFIVRIGQWMIAAPAGLIATSGFAQTRRTPPPPPPTTVEQEQQKIPDNTLPPDRKPDLKRDQKQIKEDVEKLFTLAQGLKEQVEKTDSTNVLSLSFVENAKQIEKLAKQIRSLTVG